MWTVFVLAFALLASAVPTLAHDAPHHHSKQQRLPKIAPAPGFALISQDGAPVALADLRGKVVAVTFIYTSCTDTCPMLTALMARVQDQLGQDFGERIAFVSITVDPEHDTPEVLRRHAENQGAHPPLWTFAVAAHAELQKVAQPLGLSYGPTAKEIVHTLSTAIIDREGRLFRLENGKGWDPSEYFRLVVPLSQQTGK